jgi:hypothetical protein
MNSLDTVQRIADYKDLFCYEKAAEQWLNLEGITQDKEFLKNALISLYADYDSDCNCDPLVWFCIGYQSADPDGCGCCNAESCCGGICCGIICCAMCNH